MQLFIFFLIDSTDIMKILACQFLKGARFLTVIYNLTIIERFYVQQPGCFAPKAEKRKCKILNLSTGLVQNLQSPKVHVACTFSKLLQH